MVNENHYELLRDAIFDNNQQRFEELLKQFPIDVDHLDAVCVYILSLFVLYIIHTLL
jgi:hypothetical protein